MTEVKLVKKEIVEQQLVAITCNCCATRFEVPEFGGYEELANFHNFEVEGDYGSEYPQDMDRLSFTLCSDCLQAFVSTFKINPTILASDIL
jgi:hypothetical protein